jgi:tetratricopeptide (TPR) repeat protein
MQNRQIFSSSFGNLLKAHRRRKGITQKQLAQQLGVHANTVSAWELGTYLPNTRGLVLELARLLALDDSETRRLLEASLTALSPRWLVPLPRNSFFTGREEILDSLHTCLHAQQVVALTQSYALHGLGGVGKTQIALEYAYRYALSYSAIFWIGAERAETILSSFLAIADLLNLEERQQAEQQRVVAAVQRWLSVHSQWLLIWDNVEDLDMLQRFLPAVRQGAILLTTRCQAVGTLAQGLELSPMERDEAMLFVFKRAKVLRPEADDEQLRQLAQRMPREYAAAEELVNVMGGLPLALDQAGAYIEETGCGLSDYLHRYEQRRHQLLDRRGAFAAGHPQSVVATIELTCQQVALSHPAALDVLRFCAFLAPDAIPEELFGAGAAHLETTPPAAADAAFDQAIATLRRFSLIQRQPETQTLSLHRLVQAVIQEGMSEPERLVWLKRVIKVLDAVFPEVTYEVWKQCEHLQLHVLTCAAAIQDQSADPKLFQVLRKTADYLRERSQYKQAESLYERALRIGEQVLGREHPDLAGLLDGLAWVFLRQGKYEQAELMFQRALRLQDQEQGRGPQPLLTARLLNGLACLYWTQGRHGQAELMFQRALRLQDQEQGREPQPLLTAKLLNNLAELYSEQGKYAQAEPLFQRALHIQEQTMGLQHPNAVYPLDGLAALYYRQGKYESAARLYQRALQIWEQAAGPQHLLIADLLNGLADVYTEQEKGEQAEALYRRALRIREQELGREHPRVADVLNGLAMLSLHRGNDEQAEVLFERALHIRQQVLGPEHHLTARSLNGLASLYSKQGKYEQAQTLYEQALHALEQREGQHPERADTLHGLALLQQKLGNLCDAVSFAQRAFSIRSQFLGEAHPQTVASRALHTQLLAEHGRVEAGRQN